MSSVVKEYNKYCSYCGKIIICNLCTHIYIMMKNTHTLSSHFGETNPMLHVTFSSNMQIFFWGILGGGMGENKRGVRIEEHLNTIGSLNWLGT